MPLTAMEMVSLYAWMLPPRSPRRGPPGDLEQQVSERQMTDLLLYLTRVR